MEQKQFVWWSEGHQFTESQIFSTSDEAIKAAREEYLQAAPIQDADYFNINDDTDELCPIVLIGAVEWLKAKDMVNVIFDNVKDKAKDYVSDFGYHCEEDPEFNTDEKDDNELKEVIDKWLHTAHIVPIAYAIPLFEYNCKEDKIIKS